MRRFPAKTAHPSISQKPRYCWVSAFVTQSYYMGAGEMKDAPTNKMQYIPGRIGPCTKFDDLSSCLIGWGSPHGPLWNYISITGEHVLCAYASSEKGTGERYWESLAGNDRDRLIRLRHKPKEDSARAGISGQNSHSFNLSNTASLLGF